jgi:hypothetical protein
MTELWDIGRPPEEELKRELQRKNRFEEVVEDHRELFEDSFEEGLQQDHPRHPYKVYRDIVKEEDLETEEKMVLEHLKEQYVEKWEEKIEK